jgi:hypothetical protein
MIFRLIKTNRLASFVLMPILGIVVWSTSLLFPPVFDFYQGEDQMLLFRPLNRLLSGNSLVPGPAGFLLFLLAAVLIQRISAEYGFYKTRTLLPGIMFLLITGGIREYQTFHPVYPAIIMLLLGLFRLFGAFDKRKPYSQIFDATLILGIGSLFYLNLVVLLPAFIAGGKILGRETRWREIVVSIAGFLTPWIFAFSWFFFTERTTELLQILNNNFLTGNDRFAGNLPLQVYLGILGILTLAGSYLIIVQYDEKKVSIRQYYLVFFLVFVSAVASMILIPSVSAEILLVAGVPVAFLLTNLMLSFRRVIWGEVIIYLLVGYAAGIQFL